LKRSKTRGDGQLRQLLLQTLDPRDSLPKGVRHPRPVRGSSVGSAAWRQGLDRNESGGITTWEKSLAECSPDELWRGLLEPPEILTFTTRRAVLAIVLEK
jgi:hypothetical protein